MARRRIHKLPMPLRVVLKSLAKYPVKNYSINNISQSSDSFTQLCITFNMVDHDVPVSNAKTNFTRRHKFWLDRSFDCTDTRNNRKSNAARSRHGKQKETSVDNGPVVNNVSVEGRQPQSKDAVREEAIASTSGMPEDASPGVKIKIEPGISSDMDTLVVRDVGRAMVKCTSVESKPHDVDVCRAVLPFKRRIRSLDIARVSQCPTSSKQIQIQQSKLVEMNSGRSIVNTSSGPAEVSIKVEPTASTEADVRSRRPSQQNVLHASSVVPTQGVDHVHMPTVPERFQYPDTRPFVPPAVTLNIVAPAPVTSNPLAPAPLTSIPLAPYPVASSPLAPAPLPSNPLAPAPVTSNPLAPAPVTSNPLAPVPVTSSPLALAPVTSNPLAPAPLTSNPLAPAPVTSNPLAPPPVTSNPLVPPPVTGKDVLYMKLSDMADRVYKVNPEPYRTAHGVFTITDFPGFESQFTLNRYDKTYGTYRSIVVEGAGSVRKLICDLGVRCQSAFVRQLVARIVLTRKHDNMSNGDLEWFVLLLT